MTGTLFEVPVRWRVSVELAKPHDCTLSGILSRCGGRCCYGPSYWPARAYDRPNLACGNLGPAGCVLDAEDKPVTCLLYPLKLKGDMIALHHRTRMKTSCCKGAHGLGPPLVDALRDNLTSLFGAEQVARVRGDVLAGRQSYVEPAPAVIRAVAAEVEWEAANLQPGPRRMFALEPL